MCEWLLWSELWVQLRVAPNPARGTHSTAQYSTAQYSTVQYSTVQYSSQQHSEEAGGDR
jgi:hypothetical protein